MKTAGIAGSIFAARSQVAKILLLHLPKRSRLCPGVSWIVSAGLLNKIMNEGLGMAMA